MSEPEAPTRFWSRERIVVALLALAASCILPIVGWSWTRDMWPVPLDDAYIYAQYARNFAHGELFAWSPGEGYTRGATSPLYPLLLAPGWLIGFRDHWIMLWAALLNMAGFIIAALAVHDVLSSRTSKGFAFFGVGIFITCGPALWNVASGMEAGLAMGAAAWMAREFLIAWEARATRDLWRFVTAVAIVCALRPEALATCGALSGVLLFAPGRKDFARRAGILALGAAPIAVYFLLNKIMTEEFLTASMLTKSIWGDPAILDHGQRFFDNVAGLSNVAIQVFLGDEFELARATMFVMVAGLLGIVLCGDRRVSGFGWFMLALVIQVLFLCGQRNPLGVPHARYLAPWLPIAASLLALGVCGWARAIRQLASESSFEERIKPALRFAEPISVAVCALGLLSSQLSIARQTMVDFAYESRALQTNQIAVGHYIAELNRTAPNTVGRMMTHDAGALMYFAGVQGFDAHGLCMEMPGYPLHTAQYEGTFAPWEGLEAMWPGDALPDVACVFAEGWGKPPWTAEELFRPEDLGIMSHSRLMQHIRAYRFPKELVGSAHTLTDAESGGWRIVDRMDFADLNSESAHDLLVVLPNKAPYHYEAVLHIPDREPPLADVARTIFNSMLFTVKHDEGPIRIVALLRPYRAGAYTFTTAAHVTRLSGEPGEEPRFVEVFAGTMPSAGSLRCGFTMFDGAAVSVGNVYVLQPADGMSDNSSAARFSGETEP